MPCSSEEGESEGDSVLERVLLAWPFLRPGKLSTQKARGVIHSEGPARCACPVPL